METFSRFFLEFFFSFKIFNFFLLILILHSKHFLFSQDFKLMFLFFCQNNLQKKIKKTEFQYVKHTLATQIALKISLKNSKKICFQLQWVSKKKLSRGFFFKHFSHVLFQKNLKSTTYKISKKIKKFAQRKCFYNDVFEKKIFKIVKYCSKKRF